jgi:uncharacterized protein YcnI
MKKTMIFVALSLVASASQAHVGFVSNKAEQGSTVRFALKVPHGCGTVATSSIKINIPEGIQAAKPMPKANWDVKTSKATLTKPYEAHGKTVTEDVNSLTWSNGNLPADFYDEFVFQAKAASAAGPVYFVVEQSCGNTKQVWQSASHDDAYPAAVFTIMPKAEHAHSGHHH